MYCEITCVLIMNQSTQHPPQPPPPQPPPKATPPPPPPFAVQLMMQLSDGLRAQNKSNKPGIKSSTARTTLAAKSSGREFS